MPRSLVELGDLDAHLHAQLGIEVRERLVEQEDPGSRTMARPMATRWRWPPESWRGLRVRRWLDLQDARRLLHPRLSISAFG